MAKIDALLKKAVELKASDLHVGSYDKYYVRVNGKLILLADSVELGECDVDDKTELLYEILSDVQWQIFDENHEIDFSYILDDKWRFRVNYYRQNRGGTDGVFRIINTEVPNMSEIGFPSHVIRMMQMNQGLILVTGPHGSGKTTTLAAMVNEINQNRTDHVIMIEDPIEYVHKNKSCIITQREVGRHEESFSRSLEVALREDPDVIVVGEMRDLDTISMALTCAETGHLVLGTLNTADAGSSINRMIDVFPPNSQEQVRVMIADSLRAIISQQLVPNIENDSRILALEILVGSPTLSNMIREKKTFNLDSYMQTGKMKYGMVTMDESLRKLYDHKLVSWDTALLYCLNPVLFTEQ